ncbi:hypothetical protein BGZ99_010252 [Dissophora globulifera]|uniref:Uncharacterized protein n=1 Tax=Dissophora globulifera TaxID=979702 RepID=A0A9P6UYF8_9FUNG|nr:hypothetical protein BGZ99_010252 [Dissophora globulifera]
MRFILSALLATALIGAIATADVQHGQQAAFHLEPRHVHQNAQHLRKADHSHHRKSNSQRKQRRDLQESLIAASVPIVERNTVQPSFVDGALNVEEEDTSLRLRAKHPKHHKGKQVKHNKKASSHHKQSKRALELHRKKANHAHHKKSSSGHKHKRDMEYLQLHRKKANHSHHKKSSMQLHRKKVSHAHHKKSSSGHKHKRDMESFQLHRKKASQHKASRKGKNASHHKQRKN